MNVVIGTGVESGLREKVGKQIQALHSYIMPWESIIEESNSRILTTQMKGFGETIKVIDNAIFGNSGMRRILYDNLEIDLFRTLRLILSRFEGELKKQGIEVKIRLPERDLVIFGEEGPISLMVFDTIVDNVCKYAFKDTSIRHKVLTICGRIEREESVLDRTQKVEFVELYFLDNGRAKSYEFRTGLKEAEDTCLNLGGSLVFDPVSKDEEWYKEGCRTKCVVRLPIIPVRRTG